MIWCVDYRRMRRDPTGDEFDALGRDDFVVFFEPPSLDERIVNQLGLDGLSQWLKRYFTSR